MPQDRREKLARIAETERRLAPIVSRLADITTDEASADRERHTAVRPTHPLSPWTRALVALAFVKVGGALVMLALSPQSPTMAGAGSPVSVGFVALQLLAFGLAGTVLLGAHARDRRTALVGVVLLIVASTFGSSHFADLIRPIPRAAFLGRLYPDAFLAAFIGCFLQAFPRGRPESLPGRLLGLVVRAAFAVGLVLFLANAWLGLTAAQLGSTVRSGVKLLERRSEIGTIYWTTSFGLMALMAPLAFFGLGRLDQQEGRRVRLFLGGFLGGLAPLLVLVVLGALPGLGPRLTRWGTRSVMWVPQLSLATIPITVAYAVLVRRLLPVRVVVRKAAGYLLARWTVTAALVIPVMLLIVQGYQHRNETILTALSGHTVWLIAGLGLASGTMVGRDAMLRRIDRWFFRDSYDPRDVLLDLVERSRQVHRLDQLVAVLTAGIDRAMQTESVAVLVRDREDGHFVSIFGSVEPLPTDAVLAGLLRDLRRPLDVGLEDPRSPLRWLSRSERQWLVDSRASLIVPLLASDGQLVGAITLGDRKSELPYSQEDRRMLVALAGAGALTIEHHAMRTSVRADQPPAHWWQVRSDSQSARAGECPRCGRVYAIADALCEACEVELEPSEVPHMLFGKFLFEERVGAGGMGVVYRANDLSLERTVAVKTLPGTSPEHSQRLRAEAKAMAAVTHANLAVIYGSESWRGKPMLICEYMTGGTLAGRLAAGSLPAAEVLQLGIALADALHVIHAAGLLHRDIKPSNIGYIATTPKLLDFGLVHLLTQAHALDPRPANPATAGLSDDEKLLTLSLTKPLVGTPLYLSPEIILGESPSPAADLWSLNVLLLEAITGQHPFRARTLEGTFDRIGQAHLTDALARLGPSSTSTSLAAYFRRALAREPNGRPRTARDVSDALRRIARSGRA